jgi:hypothetical protein
MQRSKADSPADADNCAEFVEFGRIAQRSDNINDFVAGLQFGQLGCGFTHSLPDQADGSRFGIGARDCQWNPLGVFVVDADDHKLARLPGLRDERGLDISGEDIV